MHNKFTVYGLFRTSRVIERAGYIAVYLKSKDRYQVIKSNIPVLKGEVILLDEAEHLHMLNHYKLPIVLDEEYMALNEEGYVEW